MTRKAVTAWFEPLWDEPLPLPKPTMVTAQILIMDGVRLARGAWVLVGRTVARVASWVFTDGESTVAWMAFTTSIGGTPWAVVLDGRAGLLAAVHYTWPDALIQRCHFHIQKGARILLTMNPTLPAGQAIHAILADLKFVWTRRQRRRWLRRYRRWERQFAVFLDERTISTQRTVTGRLRSWFTHKKLRAVRSLFRNALPHLFTYVRHPEIPRTTNHVEGGLNSRLGELIRRHRSLPLTRKQRLAALFFASKQ
ncbi:transposase [Candidatus Berkelbacteria bacterium]|nr:transposase [Candidatus Berkelbacteria bacterium]